MTDSDSNAETSTIDHALDAFEADDGAEAAAPETARNDPIFTALIAAVMLLLLVCVILVLVANGRPPAGL